MTFIYHTLSLLIAVVIIPLFTALSISSKYKFKFLPHHFGFIPVIKRDKRKTLWLYALSLGEVKAAAQVIKIIKEKSPNLKVAVSVTTDSGYEGASERLKMADHIFFHPLDCLPFTRLALTRARPDLYVVIDTGFWPGLIDQLRKKNTPVILLNGRISHRSAKRYLRAGSLFKNMFQQFERLCMQNNNSAQTTLALGVNPEKLEVVGDPKFDALESMTRERFKQLHQTFKLEKNAPLWIAGSTHAGEEEIILDAHLQLKKKHPGLMLILAPRRVERTREVAALLEKKNIAFCRRSSLGKTDPSNVILLDTMGELAEIYSLGQAAFIGRSLIEPGGGHSLIEPLSQGIAVLHGPYIENIGSVADEARKLGLAFTVYNSEDIQEKVHTLLEHKERRLEISEKAESLIQDQQGAAEKMATVILCYLES